MSINKNQMLRYRILDKIFRNNLRSYTIDGLLEELNKQLEDKGYPMISIRQIKEDIRFMRSDAGWEIEFTSEKEGKKSIYRYADTNFSIEQKPLSEGQLELIAQALDLIQGYGQRDEIQGIIDQLETLQLISSDKLRERKIIFLSHSLYLKGQNWIKPLHQYIKQEVPVVLEYKPFHGKVVHTWVFSPQVLKEYNKRWFVCGKINSAEFDQTVLALDRIEKIEIAKGSEYIHAQLDWEEYFDDIVGVTVPVDAKLEVIKLRFFNGRGHYIATKPIHGSQKSMVWLDDQTSETSIEVKWNKELEAELFSFGSDVEVIREK
jgi:hypothetical protein